MENPNEMPTTADYAYHNANENKRKIDILEARVVILEKTIEILKYKLETIADKILRK